MAFINDFTPDPTNAARAICPICNVSCSVTKSGAIRRHGYELPNGGYRYSTVCTASGETTISGALAAELAKAQSALDYALKDGIAKPSRKANDIIEKTTRWLVGVEKQIADHAAKG